MSAPRSRRRTTGTPLVAGSVVALVAGLVAVAGAAVATEHQHARHARHAPHLSAQAQLAAQHQTGAGAARPAAPASAPASSPAAKRVRDLLAGSYRPSYERLSGVGSPPAPAPAPVLSRPVIAGRALVGSRLTASAAVSHRGTTHAPTFAWYVAGRPVAGATGSSYRPTAHDLGKTVLVRATLGRGRSATSSTSRSTGKVGYPLLTARRSPTLAGTAQVGRTLSVDPGAWDVAHPTFAYRWTADGRPIAHATSPRLKLVAALRGKRVAAVVTAHGSKHTADTVTTRAANVRG